MLNPLRTCLLWTLGVLSIIAGWQGVNASTALPDGNTYSNVTGLRLEMTSQAATPAQPVPLHNYVKSAPTLLTPRSFDPAPESPASSAPTPSWPLDYIGAAPPARPDENSEAVLVAILDTGIDGDHECLSGKIVADISFVEGASTGDSYGHGTPIAGIIAAEPNIAPGVAGLAPDSRLINIKVADDRGKCLDTAVADGIIRAVEKGARVINISIEMAESTPRLQEAVDYAWRSGAVIIAAAGNEGSSQPAYPAAYEVCLSVTSIREDGSLAPLANYGDWVDVAAPGFNIYTTLPGNTYGYKHGTSFAAAYVSGLAARLFPLMTDTSGDGNLNDEVLQAVYAGCRETGIAGTGRGLIDVAGSLKQVKE